MKCRNLLSLVICIIGGVNLIADLPKVSSGKIERLAAFPSEHVAARNVDVWLPDGYSADERYPVVYMHDGAMLFDAAGTWQNKEWNVDGVAGGLIADKKIRSCIVVGVWNTGSGRHAEYCPEKPFRALSKDDREMIIRTGNHGGAHGLIDTDVRSDAYLKFLVKELKPFIDEKYPTKTGPEDTFIMGSSMGGLISIYAICEYPEVFSAAACMSTHWPMLFRNENNPYPEAMFEYLEKHLPDPTSHRIYFDHGTTTLDALYGVHQVKVDKIMREKGYGADNWITRVFKGTAHTEDDWRKRLDIPFKFLLGR